MGRRTYDWIIDHEKEQFPYKNKKCYVFSKSLKGSNEFVEFVDEDTKQLIDEFIITIAPTLIGRGIPLFKNFDNEIELELIGLRRFNQFAELHYVRKGNSLQ